MNRHTKSNSCTIMVKNRERLRGPGEPTWFWREIFTPAEQLSIPLNKLPFVPSRLKKANPKVPENLLKNYLSATLPKVPPMNSLKMFLKDSRAWLKLTSSRTMASYILMPTLVSKFGPPFLTLSYRVSQRKLFFLN